MPFDWKEMSWVCLMDPYCLRVSRLGARFKWTVLHQDGAAIVTKASGSAGSLDKAKRATTQGVSERDKIVWQPRAFERRDGPCLEQVAIVGDAVRWFVSRLDMEWLTEGTSADIASAQRAADGMVQMMADRSGTTQ